MNTENKLKSRVQGWFPQEPSLQTTATANQPHFRPNIKGYLASFAGVFAAVLLVMVGVERLGLGSGCASFAAGATAVFATIVIGVLFRKPNQQSKPLTKKERRTAKLITAANAGFVGVLLGTHFLVNPMIEDGAVTLGLWIALLSALFIGNHLMYRNFQKQTYATEDT
jgi:hypothetical protein